MLTIISTIAISMRQSQRRMKRQMLRMLLPRRQTLHMLKPHVRVPLVLARLLLRVKQMMRMLMVLFLLKRVLSRTSSFVRPSSRNFGNTSMVTLLSSVRTPSRLSLSTSATATVV